MKKLRHPKLIQLHAVCTKDEPHLHSDRADEV